jgi:subtilisin family serine protease
VIRVVVLVSAAAALVAASSAGAFTPTDPLAPRQWYLEQDRAFDVWETPPTLPPVRVAVIDSGIDGGHPEFAGKIVASRSFVGGSPLVDEQGHGTFVAGEIAAGLDNGEGIAGIAFSAQLIIAKVVRPDGSISPDTEADAIRWAVARGARVINLSIMGLRDPADKAQDTYSPDEAAAIEDAVRAGVVVVAAVGNGDQAPTAPWPYASYPAALPHVIGVGALARDGSVPDFSDRDPVYVDMSAPGEDLFSTFPRQLTAIRPACPDQGYSDCGPDEYRFARGTSFAAPQVAAAAALLIAVKPDLRAEQVAALLEHSVEDVNAADGCSKCPLLRDAYSGWGRLDITNALIALQEGPLPPVDSREPNDQAGSEAATVWGARGTITASLDFWDDPVDVYRLRILPGQRIVARATGSANVTPTLVLWKPGTTRVDLRTLAAMRQRAAVSTAVGGQTQTLAFRSELGGWYYLEVRAPRGSFGAYRLEFAKS